MQEYRQLQQGLLLWTLAIAALLFISVWISYGLGTGLNYLLGACVGVVYLKLLARDVERIGNVPQSPLQSRLALFVGLVIVATQLERLQLVPIILGFLTYKATLLGYMLVTVLTPKYR